MGNNARNLTLSAAVFFWCFELACGFSFYLLETALVCTAAAFLCDVRRRFGRDAGALLRHLVLWQGDGWLLGAFLLYLAADVLSSLYAASASAVWEKYRVTLPLLAVFTAILYQRGDPGTGAALRSAAAWSGIAVCAVTLINYFVWPVWPIHYTLRMSLRSDYNMFATVLFCAMVQGVSGSMKHPKPRRRFGGILFFVLASAAVIMQSGSRRIYIVLFPTLLLLLLTWLAEERRRAAALLLALTAAFAVRGEYALLQLGMQRLCDRVGTQLSGTLSPGQETAAAQRMATVSGGSLFAKRRVIWSIALREVQLMSPAELAVGQGAGSDILIYDKPGYAPALDSVYPDPEKRAGALSAHSLLLADLLNGGLLKLTAALWLLLRLALSLLGALRRDWSAGLAPALILGLVVLNSMISNRYGLLYDRYFILYTALLIAEGGNRRADEHRNGDDGAPPRRRPHLS